MSRISRMRMKFELDKGISSQVHWERALGMVILDLVLGRPREWERSARTQKPVCFSSFQCIIVNTGRVKGALLLVLLFKDCISKNT